ncbi:MAG: ABC transporter permease subunit [Lachnospiraceae bacterium]|nr:ABC transporter permease subunit [Lachnospiraceae bacterium]
MGRLLRFEFRKLFRQPSFYVCLGVTALLAFLSVYALYSMSQVVMEDFSSVADLSPSELAMLAGFTQASGRGQLVTALSSDNVTLLLGIFTALFICSDYNMKTAKNIIGRGYSRTGWLSAKLAGAGTACLLFCAAAMAVSYIAGTAFWKAGEVNSRDITLLLVQVLIMLGYTALFVFWSVLLRSSGGAIALNLIVPLLLGLLLTILDYLIFKDGDTMSKYWLARAMTTASDITVKSKDLWRAGLLGAVYTAVFTGLSYLVVSKRDV